MPLETPQELVKTLVEAGFSQAEIAAEAGVKQPTISRILSGGHTDPKSSVLIRLKHFADRVAAERRSAGA
jgi:predicted transcriptional regulator